MQVSPETNKPGNMAKIYNLGGIEFRLKPLDLNFANAMAPFRTALNKRIYMHTAGVDMSDVDYKESEIEELETAHKQLLAIIDDPEASDIDKTEANKRIPEYVVRLEIAREEFRNDNYLQGLIKLNTQCFNSALEETITNVNLIVTLFNKILIGDLSALTYEKLNEFTSFGFVMEVCTDALNFYTRNG